MQVLADIQYNIRMIDENDQSCICNDFQNGLSTRIGW